MNKAVRYSKYFGPGLIGYTSSFGFYGVDGDTSTLNLRRCVSTNDTGYYNMFQVELVEEYAVVNITLYVPGEFERILLINSEQFQTQIPAEFCSNQIHS